MLTSDLFFRAKDAWYRSLDETPGTSILTTLLKPPEPRRAATALSVARRRNRGESEASSLCNDGVLQFGANAPVGFRGSAGTDHERLGVYLRRRWLNRLLI
jgi:hypothetical protein